MIRRYHRGVPTDPLSLLSLIGVSALIDSINPCAFSILLLTIGFLVSLGKTRAETLRIGGAYIFGIFAAYFLIGVGVLQALSLFGVPHGLSKIVALLLVAFGVIDILSEAIPNFPIKLKIPSGAHRGIAFFMQKASIISAIGLGLFVGICEFPCTGGPYLFALGLLHDQATAVAGALYLLYYNIIFVLPLVVILVVASRADLLARVQAWRARSMFLLRYGMGIAMIALGTFLILVS